MSRLDILRAIVRPVCVIYCTVILGILALMCTTGYDLPSSGGGAAIVNTFIAITATVTTEYTIERGVTKYLVRRRSDSEADRSADTRPVSLGDRKKSTTQSASESDSQE